MRRLELARLDVGRDLLDERARSAAPWVGAFVAAVRGTGQDRYRNHEFEALPGTRRLLARDKPVLIVAETPTTLSTRGPIAR
jgi:hypothetical protein